MKYFALAALIACASAGTPPTVASDTDMFQPIEKIMIMLRNSGKVTSPNIEPLIHTTKTAQSPNQTTGRAPNNAPNPGNAEVPDSAREADGAPDMMDVREPHSQTKLQAFFQTAEQQDVSSNPDKIIQYRISNRTRN